MKDVASWVSTLPEDTSRVAAGVHLAARVLVAAFFLVMAFKNLAGEAQIVADFERWGYSPTFRRFTALLQIVGALGLLGPGTAFYGAALLATVLVGAAATHAWHDPWITVATPLVFLGVITWLGLSARPEWLR